MSDRKCDCNEKTSNKMSPFWKVLLIFVIFYLVLLTIQEITGISLASTIEVVYWIILIMVLTIPVLFLMALAFTFIGSR